MLRRGSSEYICHRRISNHNGKPLQVLRVTLVKDVRSGQTLPFRLNRYEPVQQLRICLYRMTRVVFSVFSKTLFTQRTRQIGRRTISLLPFNIRHMYD